MKPSEIMHIAKQSHIKKILLSHRMKRTLSQERETLELIKKEFNGKVIFAEDRMKLKL